MSETTESSAAPRYRHTIEDQISLWSQWPTVIGLTLLWCALWQDFRPGTLLIGLAVALFVLWAFRLPRVPFPGRMNLWYAVVFTVVFLWKIVLASIDVARDAVVFTVVFLWKIVLASIDVARDAIVKGPNIINSVVAVQLRSHDDLIVTAVGHALALIPGSLVIDVDRPSSTLYLHVLDAENQEQVDAFRAESLSIEARIIRAIGSREDYALVRAEDQAGDGVIRRHLEDTATDTGSDAGADAGSEAEKGDRA